MNSSETSGPVAIKFDLKHHWDWGNAALDFGGRFDQSSGFHGNRYM